MFASSRPDHPKSRIIGLKEVMLRVPWSKTKIYGYMKAGKFPPQAKKLEGSTSAGWYEEDVDEFLETLRPEQSTKDRSALAIEDIQEDVAEEDHPRRPLPLELRTGAAPARRAVKAAEGETLIRTGMKLQGQEVYCHLPSRKLLVAVGSMSDEYLAALTKLSA